MTDKFLKYLDHYKGLHFPNTNEKDLLNDPNLKRFYYSRGSLYHFLESLNPNENDNSKELNIVLKTLYLNLQSLNINIEYHDYPKYPFSPIPLLKIETELYSLFVTKRVIKGLDSQKKSVNYR